MIEPQPKDPAVPQPLTCASAGFCLADCAAEGLLDGVLLLASEVKRLFTNGYCFARDHRQDLRNGLAHLVACYYSRKLERSMVLCYRIAMGTGGNQLFWRLSVDDVPWVRHGLSLKDATLRTDTVDKVKWPCCMNLHQLVKDLLWFTTKSVHSDKNDIVRLCSAERKRVRFKVCELTVGDRVLEFEKNAGGISWSISHGAEQVPSAKAPKCKKDDGLATLLALGRPVKRESALKHLNKMSVKKKEEHIKDELIAPLYL